MSRVILVAVFLTSLTAIDRVAMAGGSIFEAFFSQNHTSDQINRQGNGRPIQVDTSSMNLNVKTNATINKGLRSIGLPSLLGPPKVQRQSVWVKGRGFVDITDQAQRQVDSDFRRANGEARSNPTNTAQQATASRGQVQASSPMQTTVELLRTGDALDWVAQVDFDSIQQHALQSLMLDPANLNSPAFRSQAAMIAEEFKLVDSATIVQELLSRVDRPSLTFVGGTKLKTGGLEVRLIEADRPNDLPYVVLLKPIMVHGTANWLIEDITVPAENLSLLQLYQYRLIEKLPQMPTFAAWVHPGRLQQSEQVTLVLGADPADSESFGEVWRTLAEDTKTWPISKSKFATYERLRIAAQPMKLR